MLYVEVDNFDKENKNRYMFAYLESLVTWKIFRTIDVLFLPTGHTHEDIDQAFSHTSEWLCTNDAITLSDLPTQWRQTYGGRVGVAHMDLLSTGQVFVQTNVFLVLFFLFAILIPLIQ